ncbi:catalase-like protein [Euroglyphus maynei]|uniref:Catalase n=1 Tax=Euroglyphus maynei TaxID=6958 RepID=A0A1Y3BUA1_EURMA|nr:catalase-like protein [Euroglyphus maynei]
MEPNNVSYNPLDDPGADQLGQFAREHQGEKPRYITTSTGRRVGDFRNVITVGPRGPMVLDDIPWMQEMAHFNRERIPERVVHAKGAGAFGYFEVTNTEITKYCRASLFSQLGKRTRVAARFSTVARERGSSDTVRDVRGFSIRFYTEQGNWDLVGNNTPVFFVRDPHFFMRFIHSQKRNPQTNLLDYNARWDFFTLRPESLYQVTWMYSDKGIPDGFRHMDGWGSHTYKLINNQNEPVYNKFYWRTNQGVKNLDTNTANQLAANDPDYNVHDLYDAIARKQYPSWTLFIQIMTYDQARRFEFNPFDLTKTWPENDYPYIEVGRMTLDENPKNYYAQVEQLAFSPSNRVPGIEFSPDKMLQARVFAYADAHRYRIGVNANLIPVNCPIVSVNAPTERDGRMMTGDNQGNAPNYWPNSFDNNRDDPIGSNEPRTTITTTDIDRFESGDEDNYTQVRQLYLNFNQSERDRLHTNIANDLQYCYAFIVERALKQFELIHVNYAAGIRRSLQNLRIQNKS